MPRVRRLLVAPSTVIAWACKAESVSRESAGSLQDEEPDLMFLSPKTENLSPTLSFGPWELLHRKLDSKAGNICPCQDMCNKRGIIPGMSMMLASSLSS